MPSPSHVSIVVVALAALLAGCSGASLTLAVPPLTIPGNSTAGTVCYGQGEGAGGVRVRAATYRAAATYRSEGALFETSDTVEVRVYGRSVPPVGTCAAVDEDDVELGGPFELVIEQTRPIVVGEGAAATALAALINDGDYWIGVSLVGGVSLGGTRSISFDDGRVTITF
ncbi:MAG: hypothetical protein H0U69_08585 [Trueperaceae bacterium]|nr:hypothetical protein [Trueperaceae bacterium]